MGKNLYRLNTERLQNKEVHACDVSEMDYKRVAPKIELLKRLSEIERSIYAIYDMNSFSYLMQSEEQKKLFGSDDNKSVDAEDHYKNIHPDDLGFVLETDNMVYRFFSETSPEEKQSYKLVYDFRLKNTEGIYVRYMHQVIVFEQDKNGKSWLMLIITNLLPEKVSNRQPQRRIINIKTGKLHLFNEDDGNVSIVLTKRELEILELISCGYDSVNIADKLHISVNTVNNHRQNILRKTSTENATQAVLYCKRLGVIK